MYTSILCLMLALVPACSLIDGPVQDILNPAECENDNNGREPQVRTITLGAASPSHKTATRTALDGIHVLWSEGDEIRLADPETPAPQAATTVSATLTSRSSGYGIPVSTEQYNAAPTVNSRHVAYVKYSYVKITSNGSDVTNAVTRTKANADNSYRAGIYNSNQKYQYAPAGTTVTAEINSYNGAYTIPLIQASSGYDPANSISVTLRDIQYSFDQKNWTVFDSGSEARDGFGGKAKVNPVWDTQGQDAPLDIRMALTSGAGQAWARFEGTASTAAELHDGLVAVYPYSALSAVEGGRVTISLPKRQTYTANGFAQGAFPMAGTVTVTDGEPDAAFSNLCGLFMLSLTGSCTLRDVELSDLDGKALWGQAAIPASALAEGIGTDDICEGGSTVVLDCTGVTLGQEPTTLYFVLPEGAFAHGFQAVINSADGLSQTLRTDKPNAIVRNGIKSMPAVAVDPQARTYSLENDMVRWYMEQPRYDGFGSRTSYFNGKSGLYAQDRPAPVPISWTGSDSGTYTVTVAQNGETVLNTTVTGCSYEIYNLIPGLEYEYSVKNGGTTVLRGRFRTSGQVRMIRIDDSCNARDLGGWTGLGGHSVRYGRLYRSGSIDGSYSGAEGSSHENCTDSAHAAARAQVGDPSYYSMSQASLEQLAQVGIAADLDLRGMAGEGRWGNQCMAHSRSLGQTRIPGADFGQIMTDMALTYPLEYDAAVRDVAWIISELRQGKPVVFHCKSGADRTGAVGMLIEALLGVHPGDVAKDYELTSLSSEGSGQSRPADSAVSGSYGFFGRGFTTLNVADDSRTSMFQQQAYAYLHSYFAGRGATISAEDLDWFIMFMLGMDESEYARYRH